MDKEEFERGYCERSGITREEYERHYVTLPCDCDYEECEGWACVINHPVHIHAHNRDWDKMGEALEKESLERGDS